MLIGDLKGAASIASQSSATVKLKDDADRATRAQRQERLPNDINALAAAFYNARDKGQYALMLFLAGHGLTITRRPPFGAASKEHLLFRRHQAEAQYNVGKTQEALHASKALLPDFGTVFGDRDENTLYVRHLMAQRLSDSGDSIAALKELGTLLPLREEVQGPRHPEVLTTRGLKAQCLNDSGDSVAALKELETLLPLREEVQGPSHPHVLTARHLMAQCLNDSGDSIAALKELETLLPLMKEVRGPRHPHVLITRLLLADCYAKLDQPDLARADLNDIEQGFDAAGLQPQHKYRTRLQALWDRLGAPPSPDALPPL